MILSTFVILKWNECSLNMNCCIHMMNGVHVNFMLNFIIKVDKSMQFCGFILCSFCKNDWYAKPTPKNTLIQLWRSCGIKYDVQL